VPHQQAMLARRFASSKNPYKVLGVSAGATKADIKKAYRMAAKKNHPDAPGGSHEKFQEIQQAYEQIKTGVWINKDGDGSSGGANQDRYANFKYTTRGSKSTRTYEDFFNEMHSGKKGPDFDDGPEPTKRKSPFGANDPRVAAWFRLIYTWSAAFVVLRIVLVALFPPKIRGKEKAMMTKRKPPPPKPLAPIPNAIPA
jgi:curved DNA-binding protein CbpA